ncbi:MAG: hypothetical protein IJ608_14240 [Lachnospiraceae bacterium]|nr:hypothetical protein [Lachnospiraceae bacterium]
MAGIFTDIRQISARPVQISTGYLIAKGFRQGSRAEGKRRTQPRRGPTLNAS